MEMQPLILASQSPRRKMLLEWAHVPFEVMVSDADESYPSHLTMQEVPIYIAANKAKAVQDKVAATNPPYVDQCIVAADTIVVLEGSVIGKPSDAMEAITSLQALSGKSHQVITGVVILYRGRSHTFSETTIVTFHELTKEQIEFYVENYQPFDKAGGYAIQEWIGVVGIQSIQGDFYNVMGLPVSKLLQKIKQLGII